jgi:hypothetical protein
VSESYDPHPDRLRELLDALPRKSLAGRSLAQLQDDAELHARDIAAHPERASAVVLVLQRIVAEGWAGGRAEKQAEFTVPEGSSQDALDYLKACITGYDYLAFEDGTPEELEEARVRGQARIIAACMAFLGRLGVQQL